MFIFEETFRKSGNIWHGIVLPIIFLVSIILTYFVFRVFRKNEINDETEKNKAREIYRRELLVFNGRVNEFNKQSEQKIQKILKYKNFLKSQKEWMLKKASIQDDRDVKKGISESFFLDFISKNSNFVIYKSIKYGFYHPDLIIIINDLFIDIEIDEFYVLESKEPIHYMDNDNIRNLYFQNNDFLVIRFTENQIIDDPTFCLEIIQKIADVCLSQNDLFKDAKYLKFEEDQWTYEQAFKYAYENSRSNIFERIINARKKISLLNN